MFGDVSYTYLCGLFLLHGDSDDFLHTFVHLSDLNKRESYLIAVEHENESNREQEFEDKHSFVLEVEIEQGHESPAGGQKNQPVCDPFLRVLAAEYSSEEGQHIADDQYKWNEEDVNPH